MVLLGLKFSLKIFKLNSGQVKMILTGDFY